LIQLRNVRNIAVFVFADVEELDFVGVYEVLCKSRGMGEEGTLALDSLLHVEIIARESPVLCRNGMKVVPHKVTSDFNPYDLLIIPGGNGITSLVKDASLLEKVRQFARDHVICSVCTGSLLLGAAGVLGKRALTHHEHVTDLEAYAEAATGRVHVDNNVITSAGISSSIDLGLVLLKMIYDEKTARKVADRLELPTQYNP
jgi:transcriptional regulator GlxA family with amidase domain